MGAPQPVLSLSKDLAFETLGEHESQPDKRSFVVWLTVVVITALQLTNGLVMMYLANKR